MAEDKQEDKIEEEKIVLVVAVHCLVDEEGNVNEKLKNYLDSLKNKKIILTNAPKEKEKIFFKNIKSYEIFTLENNPNKKDPEYYKKFLEKFKLSSKDVVYLEHDEESVKSAESVGIKTILYKDNLEKIKDFINKNIKSNEKHEHVHDEKSEHSHEKKHEIGSEKTERNPEEKVADIKKEEKKIEKKHVEKPKKSFAEVNAYNLPISTKTAMYISKFIKGKTIPSAIMDLELVIAKKKPVPYKGEIPHRKGKIMSGRFPKKASLEFIKLLKSLSSNATYVGINVPIISEAIPNLAPRPFGKFGAVKRKRTHVKLKAVEAKEKRGDTPTHSPRKQKEGKKK